MIAIHPLLRAIPLGILALWLCAPLGFPNDCLAACAALIFVCVKLSKSQQAYEERLLFRKRLYNCDIEQVFAGIQRALSNTWLQQSHWQNQMTELSTGYMLYRYEWREPESKFDDGRTRHHANLQIECVDRSDLAGAKTVVTFSFDGLPNEWIKRTFYEAVQLAMGAIDAYLPDHTILKPEFDSDNACNTGFIDHEMQGS